MRAALMREHGDISVAQMEEAEAPVPAAGEVVLKVPCAGLNHLDLWVCKGRTKVPMPHILGSDAVGIVTAVGENVESPLLEPAHDSWLDLGLDTGFSAHACRCDRKPTQADNR